MNEQAIRFRIGIFVLAALILMAVLITLFGGLPNYFKPSTTYTIEFNNAQGVGPGTPVRRSGVKIGEVRKIMLDNETGKVDVVIQIENGFQLRKGDRPTVQQSLLGGDSSIAFLPPEDAKGMDTTPVDPGSLLIGYNLADAGVLLQKATEVAPTAEKTLVEIAKAAQSMEKVFQKIDKLTPNVDKLLQSLDKAVPGVDETMQEFRKVAKSINEMTPELKKTNDEIRELAATARKMAPSLDATMQEFRKTAKSINDMTPDLKKTNDEIRELAVTARKMAPSVDATIQEIRKMLPDLRKTGDEAQLALRNWGKVGERVDLLIRTNEDKVIKTVDSAQLAMKRVGDLLSDENQKNLRDTLKNVKVTSDRFDGMARNTDEFIKEARVTLKQATSSFAKIDNVLTDVQKATKPFGERGESILKNLDEGTDKLNKTMADLRDILQAVARSDGSLQKLLTDPSLYNNLNDVSCSVNRLMPRLDHILADMEIFADKLARHPESIGLGGVVRPGSGLKASPSMYKVIPAYP